MSIVVTRFGSRIGNLLGRTSYWAVQLTTGEWVSEIDDKQLEPNPGDNLLLPPRTRRFDWSLDLIDTGDINKIKELWLFCPRSRGHPLGETAVIRGQEWGKPLERGTAFMFKIGTRSLQGRGLYHQAIGQVYNKETGDCECYIWDAEERKLYKNFQTNIYRFATWRPGLPGQTAGVAPPGLMDHRVIGIDLT